MASSQFALICGASTQALGEPVGIFDFFISEEKQIVRHTRRLMNRDSQPEDREASSFWLANNGSPPAIAGLLRRFEIHLDHSMKDRTEKESLYTLLLELGPGKVILPLKTWLRVKPQFAIPLRLLKELGGKETALNLALELLNIEYEKDDFKPKKKIGLLIWMIDYRDDRLIEAAAPLLGDFDEGVRCAAADLIIAQEDNSALPHLAKALFNPEEDSGRLKIKVAQIFQQRQWTIPTEFTKCADRLPSKFTIQESRVVARKES